MAELNLKEMSQYSQKDEFSGINASTFANPVVSTEKETTENKGSNGNKINTPKFMSYPVARDDKNSETEYLEIMIEKYSAPGLTNAAFTGFEEDFSNNLVDGKPKPRDAGDKILSEKIFQEGKSFDFGLTRGADKIRKNRGKKSILHIIHLPIPRNVTDTQGVQYGEGSLNPLEALGTSLVSAGFSPNQPIDKLKGAVNATLNKGNAAIKDPATQQLIGASISGSLIGALGGNVTPNQLISRATGQVLNPNLELLFNGVGLRVFTFSFQFFPRNRTEGIEVMNIIKTLKYQMAPSRNKASEAFEGIFIGAPSIFQLQYKKGGGAHPFLNKFLPTFLSDMKVNYTASGAHSTFYDGTPTHIQVDMQFKEINPIFKEDYEGVGGVGY